MQKHDGPGNEPGGGKRPPRTTAWWLMLVIFGLLGLIVSQVIQRWI